METTQPTSLPSPADGAAGTANRQPTPRELEQAIMVLRSLSSGTAISLLEISAHVEPENSPVLVTTDFSEIGKAVILLVPPGEYRIDASAIDQVTHIVGLANNRDSCPVLILDGEESDVIHADTGDQTPLRIFQSHTCFANVTLKAVKATVLETCFGIGDDRQFSDVFFNVEWRGEIDALNTYTFIFLHGRNWALDAYGKGLYRARNGVEKGLDFAHEGVMNAIDNAFRPLTHLAQKIDDALDLK